MDMQYGLYYSKTINLWNTPKSEFVYSMLMLCVTMLFMWLNCAAIKILKVVWKSKLTIFFNLSSVTSLYISSILLFYIPDYITYNTSVTINLDHRVDNLDAVILDPFQSFYIRSIPLIVLGAILNNFLVWLLDHGVYYKQWRLLVKVSLGRQAVFNSSSILCDYLDGVEMNVENEREKEGQAKKKAIVTVQKSTSRTDSSLALQSNGKYYLVQTSDHSLQLVDENLTELTTLIVPLVLVGIILNILIALLFDQIIYYKKTVWDDKQFLIPPLYCMTTFMKLNLIRKHILYCKARRLSTPQWFFMNHLFLFGLPDKEVRVRKKTLQGTTTGVTQKLRDLMENTLLPKTVIMVTCSTLTKKFLSLLLLSTNIKVLKDLPIAIQ
ncbi:hypothetical protein THRCLA_04872 [Thraustotheca clavata]|uniref:Uncharacterized protein n=1 Tax=Thraustotheca clavata TaxID=74557 RepID=A0A1V9ZXP9_9STRA|nr:hypothetical protein THRCLA_04872 [Thraustotheca clavata]